MAEALEMRLLRCTLGGKSMSISSDTAPSEGALDSQVSELLSAIQLLVLNVERGSFHDALCSPSVKSSLWQPQKKVWSSSASSPEGFYSSVRTHIQSFLDGDGVLKALLVMAAGVSVLLAFWQANVTGPSVVFPPCQTLILQDHMQMLNEEEWNAWALKQLMVDGCDLVGLCTLPQYLVLAKMLLVDSLDAHSAKTRLPSSIHLWACRALLAHQLILAERSSSLYTALSALKPELFQVDWLDALDGKDALMLKGAAQLEYGFVEYVYGRVDHARSRFEAAREACGLELYVTGALGFRTAHQIEPKAQMVLITRTRLNQKEHSSEELEQPTESLPKDKMMGSKSSSMEEDILLHPKLVSSDTNTLEKPQILSGLQQAVVLAQCLDVKKSNPDDDLRGWQMAPFIEAVDGQEVSLFLIKRCCQLLRVRWECTRSRTKQRALLMMEQLVEDVCGASASVPERMCYAFCVHFPTLSVLRKELADMLVSCGLVGEALRTYEELELWNSLIDCYCLLGKKGAALDLIKKRLEQQPEDPRLWCALGDVTLDEDCYRKAWEVSKHHFGRAQRSLGRCAYNKAEYVRSMEHWEAALTLNSLHADGWFALGSASLKARNLDKAVDSFTHAVQLEPENGEAWNNIAAIHMTRKKSKEAFVAFKEALKYKRSSWQMWENYAHVALDVDNFGQAIEAVTMVLELSKGKRNVDDCLSKLMDEIEARWDSGASSIAETYTVTPLEAKQEILEQSALANGMFEHASSLSDHALQVDPPSAESEWLVTRVGKVLSKAVQTSPTSATWGILARWHCVKGDLTMSSEALLKQVRSLQGSGWQHNKNQFEDLCRAAVQLCHVYMKMFAGTGNKKELYSAQMLLRNLVKQGETFSNVEIYATVVECLADVQRLIQDIK